MSQIKCNREGRMRKHMELNKSRDSTGILFSIQAVKHFSIQQLKELQADRIKTVGNQMTAANWALKDLYRKFFLFSSLEIMNLNILGFFSLVCSNMRNNIIWKTNTQENICYTSEGEPEMHKVHQEMVPQTLRPSKMKNRKETALESEKLILLQCAQTRSV